MVESAPAVQERFFGNNFIFEFLMRRVFNTIDANTDSQITLNEVGDWLRERVPTLPNPVDSVEGVTTAWNTLIQMFDQNPKDQAISWNGKGKSNSKNRFEISTMSRLFPEIMAHRESIMAALNTISGLINTFQG